MAQLIVGLTPSLAAALDAGVRTEDVARLEQVTLEADVELRPQSISSDRSPDTGDETVWYWADTDQSASADAISRALLRVAGVTAAYLKPDVALP